MTKSKPGLLIQRPQWSLPKIGKEKQNIEKKGFTSFHGNYKKKVAVSIKPRHFSLNFENHMSMFKLQNVEIFFTIQTKLESIPN
jgi:hypothetical protein